MAYPREMAAITPRACSVARTLELVGEKWSLLAVRELMLGNHRFDRIVASTGAPRDVLTTRLRGLEERGLVERVLYQEKPIRHEYRLTPLGKSLFPVITALRAWGDTHLAGPEGATVAAAAQLRRGTRSRRHLRALPRADPRA